MCWLTVTKFKAIVMQKTEAHTLVQLLYRFCAPNLASTHCNLSKICAPMLFSIRVNRNRIESWRFPPLIKVQLLFKNFFCLELRMCLWFECYIWLCMWALWLQKWVNIFLFINRLKWITPALSVLVIRRLWDQVQIWIFLYYLHLRI